MESKFSTKDIEVLNRAFKRCDIDGSGTISKKELIEICIKSEHEISEGHFDFIFSCIDKDKSGEVDYEEFIRFIYVCQIETSELEQARLMFDGFDKDGNGMIDKEELFKAFTELGVKITKEDVELAFDILDKNGDGSMDFGEFIELFNMLKRGVQLG